MTRRTLRSNVSYVRPTSAWLLVAVASAMLWITGQLEVWLIGLQLAGIVLSFHRRRNPYPWQHNALALNLAIIAITALSLTMDLLGRPPTVTLAHFAAPTQALQLLDARPRKSEYLLVTLALFQVLLAATLTDSLLFPPLLVLFVVASVWTLMLHTLHTEAIEGGDPPAVTQTFTRELKGMTAVASGASILLALGIFMLLPRMRDSMVQAGGGANQAVAGFSDRVELGVLGRIRMDDNVILRVETLEGEPADRERAYWRGLAFDSFDGREWSIYPPHQTLRPGSTKFGIELGYGRGEPDVVQRIVREPVEGGVLFSPGLTRRVSGALWRIHSDVNGSLYSPARTEERVRYTIAAITAPPDPVLLRRDRATPPRDRGDRYLSLPELDDRVRALARQIVENKTSDAERARAIERYLRLNGVYTDTPPVVSDEDARSPVEEFLFGGLAGHCEYFASAMVVLARSVGLPSRLVNGFAGGRENPLGGFVELAGSDAHAWVEVHYEDAGWVRYDPTPPALRLRAEGALSLSDRFAALASAVELWWFQRIVDFDSSDQVAALRAALGAWRSLRGAPQHADSRRPRPFDSTRDYLDRVPAARVLLLVVLVALLTELLRRHHGHDSAHPLPTSYRQALRLLARRGLAREAATTARGFARQVATAVPPTAGCAFTRITEAYLCERFGGSTPPDSTGDLEILHRQLGR